MTEDTRGTCESPPARTSCPVQGPKDVVEQRTAGQAADHVTVRAFPVLLQVRLVLQHLHTALMRAGDAAEGTSSRPEELLPSHRPR